MPQRRKATFAALSALVSTVSHRQRFVIFVTLFLSAIGKILAVIAAERVVDGDVRGTAVAAVVGVAIFGAARVLMNGARVDAQCEIQRSMTRALLESDVLAEPTPQPIRALFEPATNARTLVGETIPELAASAIAAVAVAPIVVSTLPSRALFVAAVAITAVMAALVALSRVSAAVERRVFEASQRAHDRLAFAVEGRLELAARGAEAVAMKSVDRALDEYRTTAKRGAWASAMLGRLPLAAGLAVVVVIVVADAAAREAVTSAILRQALVLGACLPIAIGVVMRGNELLRLSASVGPVIDVLSAPQRAELARTGLALPSLPAAIAFREVSFGYDTDLQPTISALSFDWPVGGPLFIEGRNGAGKSTLLRLVLGLRSPQLGVVSIAGADLESVDLQRLRRSIAYLPQRPYLGEHFATLREALCSVGEDVSAESMIAALERVGLTTVARLGALLDVEVGELSAGQRQRLALARILLQDASIYLLDEPDANLDRPGIALVGEIVLDLVQRGRMVAIAAHTDGLAAIPGTRLVLD